MFDFFAGFPLKCEVFTGCVAVCLSFEEEDTARMGKGQSKIKKKKETST